MNGRSISIFIALGLMHSSQCLAETLKSNRFDLTKTHIPSLATCELPISTAADRIFYVDPEKGSRHNDGSADHPWRTLEEVFDDGLVDTRLSESGTKPPPRRVQTTPVVKAGDTIVLRSGNHGKIKLRGAYNDKFITIVGAPGQTPIIKQLSITGGSHWIFKNIVFDSLNDSGVYGTLSVYQPDYYLLKLDANAAAGPLDNIFIEQSTFRSTVDAKNWNQQNWREQRVSGIWINAGMERGDADGGHCFVVDGNNIYNIGTGIDVSNAVGVAIVGNNIDHFADDAIDYGSSDMFIFGNKITNSVNDEDGFHRDAMQGQPYWGAGETLRNLNIIGNYVINQTDPDLKFPGYLQGIDEFDGIWDGVNILNNVVVTNAYHGISFYGAKNIHIINNTVMASAMPGPSVEAGTANSYDVLRKGATWIAIRNAKDGSPSQNAIVRNNISDAYLLNQPGILAADHNIIASENPRASSGFPSQLARPIVAAPSEIFAEFDPVRLRYTLTPRPKSPAVGAGPQELAPDTDLTGAKRAGKMDIGAYALQKASN